MSKWKKEKTQLTGYKKFMTDDEIKKLIAYTNTLSKQISIIFYILIFMGLRVKEVVTLKTNDILGNKITYRQVKVNRLHIRIIPNYIKDLLYDYIEANKHKFIDDYIFPPLNNRSKNPHIQTSTIRWVLCRFRKKYNLNDIYYIRKNGCKLHRISVHTIRHYFLTKFFKNCNDLLLTCEVIGHQHIDVTASYIRAWQKFEREEEIVNTMVIM